MSGTSPSIPSPMTPERLKLMQQRAEAGEPLALQTDRPEIKRRHASQRKNGHNGSTRRVGHRAKQTVDSRFDDEGEPIKQDPEERLWKQYLDETKPGTDRAIQVLSQLKKLRGVE